MMTNMKKSKKSKKSTTKQRAYKISPLIPIIAVIEVLVLIGVSTYAWYYIQASKKIGSGTISVDADSGLDIDFKYANVDDSINIWNYVGSDFTFEPATSMDGRMIYFPTSGTFTNTDTRDLVLRDGTVNDINSKYISIDFELTNNSTHPQTVYLNNKSFFHVVDSATESQWQESRALRLAFYANDGVPGNVGSDLLRRAGASDGGDVDDSAASANPFTLYFDNQNSNWSKVYAHVYDYVDGGSGDKAKVDWPGIEMTRVSGTIYSATFDNPPSGGGLTYDKVIFNNNNGAESAKIALTSAHNGKMFTSSSAANAAGSDYHTNTVYFIKPYGWGSDVYCYAWDSGDNAYTPNPGDKMSYVGSGIYSYTYNSANTGGLLFDNGSLTAYNQTTDITISNDPSSANYANDKLFYCTGSKDGSNKYEWTKYGTDYSQMTYKTIYLFNTFQWEKPYATVMIGNDENTSAKADIAMTYLSGNVYYCTVPSIYTYGYFKDKEHDNNNYRTAVEQLQNQTVYRLQPTNALSSGKRSTEHYLYNQYIKEKGYPVISPGVSAGFQRPYSPVLEIDPMSGAATKIIPAYSNSIDNYILSSTGTELFVLQANHMVSLSMIIWLEGTDEACTGAAYPGNLIDLRLEFSTKYTDDQGHEQVVNRDDTGTFIYNFYDKTRELWTSNRQSTESGVTVAPVMQLYDNTAKRGYLMQASKYEDYDGKRKVSCWTVEAPQSIARLGHDLQFRRVNPYNEDEVWNYWHAGPVAGERRLDANGEFITYSTNQVIYSIATSTTNVENDTINFTAFADGSPIRDYMEANYRNKFPSKTDEEVASYLSDASMPNESCGGLWGNHNVRTLTLLDGTDGYTYKSNNGIMSIKYSYHYTDDVSLAIEYKASGPNYNDLYFFVVPESLYHETEGTADVQDVYFKRYYNFDSGYAINSSKNDKLLFDRSWNAGTPRGMYYSVTQTYKKNQNADYYGYWGSDVMYVQTTNTTCGTMKTDLYNDRVLRAEFSTADTENDDDFWVQIFANDEFKPDEANTSGTGYPVVIPNDHIYDQYRIHVSSIDTGFNSLLYGNYNALTGSDTSSDTSTLDITNVAYVNGVSKHICKYWKYYDITIYFETDVAEFNNAEGNGDYNKRAHIYKGGEIMNTNWEGAKKVDLDGEAYGKQRYRVTFNPYYTNVIFYAKWDSKGINMQFPPINVTPFDNNRIYSGWKNSDNSYGAGWTQYQMDDEYVHRDHKWVLHADSYSAEQVVWPHYSAAASGS